MGKLFNDITEGLDLPSESEITEATRRAKISETAKSKMQHDEQFRHIRQTAPLKGAETKRLVPKEDYEKIIREYWDNSEIRPLKFCEIIGNRYGVKYGAIEKIIMNWHNILPNDEYQELVDAYNAKYTRSDMMKQVHAQKRRDNVQAGKSISLAKQSITAEQALEIYERVLPYKNKPGSVAFQKQLAKEYGISYNKVRMTAMRRGHPVFDD